MRSAFFLVGLVASCGGSTQTTEGPPMTASPFLGGGGNACAAAAAEHGIAGLWRLAAATCGDEAVPMEPPALEEELEVSVAWPNYATIAHTFVKKDDKLCRYRVDRRVEPGGAPQRIVETGRWAELAGAQGYAPASATDCPMTPESALDGELSLQAEDLVLRLQSPSFCPGKPWIFRYRRIPCAPG
jgi:hypothetical protein